MSFLEAPPAHVPATTLAMLSDGDGQRIDEVDKAAGRIRWEFRLEYVLRPVCQLPPAADVERVHDCVRDDVWALDYAGPILVDGAA